MNKRYNMCDNQPAQIDCRHIECKYQELTGCTNVSPAITLNVSMVAHCWSLEKKEPELKPCPFCGGDAYMSEDVKFHVFFVACSHCVSRTGNHKSKEYASDAWNKRTP